MIGTSFAGAAVASPSYRFIPEHSFRRNRFDMGKGDPRTRRGKIFKGSFGKSRPQRPVKKGAPKAGKPAE